MAYADASTAILVHNIVVDQAILATCIQNTALAYPSSIIIDKVVPKDIVPRTSIIGKDMDAIPEIVIDAHTINEVVC